VLIYSLDEDALVGPPLNDKVVDIQHRLDEMGGTDLCVNIHKLMTAPGVNGGEGRGAWLQSAIL